MVRFNLRKLNDKEVREQYQIKIVNSFAALENLDVDDGDSDVDINRAWGRIKENIKASATESLDYHLLKQHKPWFDEECSKLIRSKEAGQIAMVAEFRSNTWS
jgi:hypothetical protein